MADLLQVENLISLITLSVMEVVLGIDNLVFITILSGRLPPERRPTAARLGLAMALVTRLGLLFAISWVMGLTKPLFSVASKTFSGRDLILAVGGAFLVGKAAHEIYDKLEGEHDADPAAKGESASLVGIVIQIALLDIVFSLDSVITAVGMVDSIAIMVVAMLIAVGTMLVFARGVGTFIERHPSVKILALSFLILIGVMLFGEGMGQHFPKGYVYVSMGFAVFVELLNMRFRKKRSPVTLRVPYDRISHP